MLFKKPSVSLKIILIIFGFIFFSCSTEEKKKVETLPEFFPDSLIFDLDKKVMEKKAKHIEKIFNKLAKGNWFNGTVIYGERGKIIYKNAFGYGNLRKKDSLTTKSSFQLASVSKMFTAMAIMILKENGKLNYDDTVNKYIPEFPYKKITIRHLLTHRSGLPRYMSVAHENWKNKSIPLKNQDMLDLFIKHKPAQYFQADKGFHYCNSNYTFLAIIVERISKTTFDKFVNQNIFIPLEMNNSFVYNMNGDTLVSDYIKEGVQGHRKKGWRYIKERNDYLNGVMGDKGVYSSVEDLFKFNIALDSGLLVSKETLKEAFSPGSPKYWKRNNNYGFGWRIKSKEDSTVFHYGWWKGFRAFYIRDMKNDKVIIALSNKDKGPGSSILWNIIHEKSNCLGLAGKNDPVPNELETGSYY
ncbi:MAG: beta-lactamase family protein [Bacteroidales bacterium]|nr:beta-lactamase family protein [Bacteroidales bacterium]